MYLGDVWIAPEEVERIAWEDGELTLELRWPVEEVPILFGLSERPLFRWHEEDPRAGIPVRVKGWRFLGQSERVQLHCRLR